MAEFETTKALCNFCEGERNHFVLYMYEWSKKEEACEEVPEEDTLSEAGTYELLKCCGCENVKLREIWWSSYETDMDGEPTIHTEYYPPLISRRMPDWLGDYLDGAPEDSQIGVLLSEVYVALRNELPSLAAMGIRAIIEHIMISKIGDQGSFGRNLLEFEKQGFVSRLQRERLETILDAGHAVIHRSFTPNFADLNTLMDICENTVQILFVHDTQVDDLKQRIPGRTHKRTS